MVENRSQAAAWDLVLNHLPLLLRWSDRIEDAAEQMYRIACRWRPGGASYKTYVVYRLRGAAKARAVNDRRRGLAARRTVPLRYADGIVARSVKGEVALDLAVIVGRLPASEAELLRRRFLEHWSTKDLAGQYGIHTTVLSWRLRRALNRCRRLDVTAEIGE